uniref:Uncharacterized protein n=1 Tax=Alteromonadaceae bacterium PE-TB08W TaxID=1199097 RepID=A0A3G9ELX0_9ALTE|nr:hypothetical protein (truncated) [Alteromonadaceae bacterium PE-TB08W]
MRNSISKFALGGPQVEQRVQFPSSMFSLQFNSRREHPSKSWVNIDLQPSPFCHALARWLCQLHIR